jgi:hypothetical protein
MDYDFIIGTATKKITDFITANNIQFQRGDSNDYFRSISKLSLALSIPQLQDENKLETIVLKNYFVLWNILVDDEIDRNGASSILEDSFGFITTKEKSKAETTLIESIATQCSKDILSEELTRLDLINICQGFLYEKIINSYNVANVVEYEQLSSITASINILLDIDLSYCGIDKVRDLGQLRTAYYHFGRAIKFSSDIGSIAREISSERNLNLTLLKLGELQKIEDTEAIFESARNNPDGLRQSISLVADLAMQELRNSERIIKQLDVDYSGIYYAVENIVKNYTKGTDIFFNTAHESIPEHI